MILFLSVLLMTAWVASLAGMVGVRTGLQRPTTAEGAMWVAVLVAALAPFLKAVGPLEWFMAPTLLLNPWLNWGVLIGFALIVPVRNAFHLFRADAALEDYSGNSLDLGVAFTRWVDGGGGGRKLRDVQEALGLRQPPLFRASNIGSPITRGILRPVVLIPISWIPDEALDQRGQDLRVDLGLGGHQAPEDVFAAILHELSHHQGRDLHRALLKVVACLVVPMEWTFTDGDNQRFGAALRSWPSKALHGFLRAARWPVQAVVQAAWAFQESRADAGAFRFDDQAHQRLRVLRGGDAAWEGAVQGGRAPKWSSWALAGVIGVVGVGGALVMPGRPFLALTLGGVGGIRGLQPAQWSLQVMENNHGQRPTMVFLPKTRLNPPRVLFEAEPDLLPHDPANDPAQGLFLFAEAYPPEPIHGPARYSVRWDFWRQGPTTTFPFDPPVLLLLRPVESFRVSPNPTTMTYFSADRPDFKLQSLGGGHFRAEWSVEIPEGRSADFFSIEWRAYTPGRVVFQAPLLEKAALPQKK